MSLTTKLIVSLVIAVLAATVVSTLLTGSLFAPVLLIAFAAACVASALVGAAGSTTGEDVEYYAEPDSADDSHTGAVSQQDGNREYGKVKWFNVSKGFGFIVKDDGEEIFVHFRSIRGSGRRGLKDGQTVSFVTTQSDKGPQAEDVAPED
ncbi:MAG: hypothetical protein Hals2KO_23600 [Halioglobus sp.]